MRKAHDIQPSDEVQHRLREYDLREIDNPDPRDAFRLKYLDRLSAVTGTVRARVPAGARVLELGCSQANASLLLAQEGYRCVALDLLPSALAYARQKHTSGDCSFVAADVRRLPLREGAFDAVLVGELLEHLPRPAETLRALAPLVAPGGLVVVTVPNGAFGRPDAPAYIADSTGDAMAPTGHEAQHHSHSFDRAALLRLAAEAGLSRPVVRLLGSVAMSQRAGLLKRLVPLWAVNCISRAVNTTPWLGERLSYTLCLVATRPKETPQ